MSSFYVGVDVGTKSVRAALVNDSGRIMATAEKDICINHAKAGFYEQSSIDIWRKCCDVVKMVTKSVSPDVIHGVGFDATCSLVVLDEGFSSVAVNLDKCEDGEVYDIIMWMDHRAGKEADFINSRSHDILKYVGGKISLEMEPPKLLWLKKNLPQAWKKATHFFDLCDFLTFKATGSLSRSLCSVTCKWLYSAEDGWSEKFWKDIDLEELTDNRFYSIGNNVVDPGVAIGSGLNEETASLMNLNPRTPVGAGLLDAHCGGIGTIGGDVSHLDVPCVGRPFHERIALICGTSSCHMASNEKPLFVPGVWGPYYAAMFPNFWTNEGGQSAAGSSIDHVVQSHPAFQELESMASNRNQNIYECLNAVVLDLAKSKELAHPDFLTASLHIVADFHGNRSPLADPLLSGSICGLTLDTTLTDLANQYLAALQALANGSRHILDTMEQNGHKISTVFMCGGLSKNPLFVQTHANALGKPIVFGQETETVLLGAAILGACASKDFPTLQSAMQAMCKPARVVYPVKDTFEFYERKYRVFLAMTEHQIEYRKLMKG